MRIRSTITDRIYEQEEMIYIVNPVQIAKYIKHHCTLYDLLADNDKLIGVFSKRETQPLYEKWRAREI